MSDLLHNMPHIDTMLKVGEVCNVEPDVLYDTSVQIYFKTFFNLLLPHSFYYLKEGYLIVSFNSDFSVRNFSS